MAVLLKNLYSIINGIQDAKDKQRAFTFIEFIKEFGYDNTTSSFLNDYKSYLLLWSNSKNNESLLSNEEFIRQSLIDTLKSIVLTYSSYEEQDFIANINWEDEEHRKVIIPLFAEKLRMLCEFYKNKRQEACTIVDKNKFKGSKTSLEQIIYDKIIDFYFENRNLSIQNSKIKEDLQNNLSISIEQYVDIYSSYFDIPREQKFTDKTRKKFINSNINTPRYEDYIEVAKVISDTLFSGEVYLEEIPLIAQIGLDLSQNCAGDVATLRDALLNEATINLISINDQIALRRKLYEKYLGCDLYYIYCDTKDNIYIDLLTKAENPSGNLLNCGTADTAVVEANDFKLLHNIGLFFKPDKTGIIKVSADNYKWEIDKSKLTEETFYVFPDPNKCGDIGNNKSQNYPLVFEYKLDSYIKNISSGWAKDEPLVYLSSPTWNTYYSNQDRDFILNHNEDFNYSFTSLANCGILRDYQKDLYGNEYGLFKGYTYSPNSNELYINSEIDIPEVSFDSEIIEGDQGNLLNGGYYRDPRITSIKNKFPHDIALRISDDYRWSGIKINASNFTTPPSVIKNRITLGNFLPSAKITYIDHYQKISEEIKKSRTSDATRALTTNTKYCSVINDRFVSKLKSLNISIISEKDNLLNLKYKIGKFYIKEPNKFPKEVPLYSLKDDNGISNSLSIKNVVSYGIFENLLILEEENLIHFFKQEISEEIRFYEICEPIVIKNNQSFKILYNESKNKLIIAILTQNESASRGSYTKTSLLIKEFNLETFKLTTFIDTATDIIPEDKIDNFDYLTAHSKIKDVIFTYNNELEIYLLAYLLNNNGSPYLYQHQFKMFSPERFWKTLESSVTFNYNNKDIKYIFNEVITAPDNNGITFFVEDNG